MDEIRYVLSEHEQETCEKRGTPWLLGEHAASKNVVVFRAACKTWACPICGEANRMLWAWRAAHGVTDIVQRGDAVHFVTLTFPGWMSADGTRRRWRKSWPKLSARFRRAWNGVRYLYVHEQHKSGRMHVHMVTDAGLSRRWWKDNCATTGFGFMADADEVHDRDRVARYVAKQLATAVGQVAGRKMRAELTKQAMLHAWPDGWRRVSTSRNWPKLPETPGPEGWCWRTFDKRETLIDIYDRYRMRRWTVNQCDHRTVWGHVSDLVDWWQNDILGRLDEDD